MREIDLGEKESEFVALLTEIQLSLTLYVRSLLPGDPAAGDVAQQANATIWQKREDFSIGSNFKAWAFRIARYEVLNYRKKQAREARLVFSDELEHIITEELVADPTDVQRRQTALQHCLGELRPQDRELLMHRYSSKGTLKEYAVAANRSVGGLKVTLHRLRNSLLACIRGRLHAPGDSP